MANRHVQAVLDATQQRPIGSEVHRLLMAHEARRAQTPQSERGRGLAQLGVPPAPDELQRLDEEFRLTDAPLAQLQVARGIAPKLAPAALDEGHHLSRDARVDLPAVDEGTQGVEQRPAEAEVSGDRTRAD